MKHRNFIGRLNRLDEKGLNLIELLIAMAILSIGLLGTASLIVGIIRGNQVSRNVTIATTMAKDKVEHLGSLPYSELPSTDSTVTEDYSSMADYPTFKRVTQTYVNSPAVNMKKVVVEVHWRTGTNPVTLYAIFVRQ